MNQKVPSLVLLFLFIGTVLIAPLTLSDSKNITNSEVYEGYVLYAPEYAREVYLLDMDNNIVQTWQSEYIQGLGTYLLENGNIIRACSKMNNHVFSSGGFTGRVEMYDWSGSLTWEFEYSSDQHCLHHDLKVLPNGNILMTAWEYKSGSEAREAGINPNNMPQNEIWPDHIIEVQPTGSSGGTIVWEWHVWDHLIQDYDQEKDNYGIVADHPELIDINSGPGQTDFNHINAIDYNEELDQILLSAHQQNEIWIIDHSTTTKEAAGHSGGRYGKGGDLLYRWGNPQVYNRGTNADKQLFGQHDAQWIDKGCPGAGNILVFNNGIGRPIGMYSSVDEFTPPLLDDGTYELQTHQAYGPSELSWRYTYPNPVNFFASHISGTQRLPNGNTLICQGEMGYFFEVTPDKKIVWEYMNQFPNPTISHVFKIRKYGVDYEGLGALFKQPEKPTISGPSSGSTDVSYSFTTITSDPEGDDLYYYFDWGDGSYSGWIGPFASGKACTQEHSWSGKGDFQVIVKAKDVHGLESSWSDPWTISMPKNKSLLSIINDLIEEYQYLIQMLKYATLTDMI
jgi:hypothetical protein